MSLASRPPLVRLALAVLVSCLVPPLADAQYFGRNKVQYRSFDFQVLKTDHFDIHYYPEERAAVEQAARMAERWYARLSRLLHHRFGSRQPVILYASHPEFEQTNAIMGELGEGTGGVTEFLKRRIVLPFAGPLAETDHVLGHELVHAFQFDIGGQGRAGMVDSPALRLPLWFIEGMAEYLSVGPVDPHTAMWMRDAARRGKVPTVRQLRDPRFFPYRYGQALWSYIAGRWGDEVVGQVLKAAGRGGDAESALEEALGIKTEDLTKEWHQALQDAYRPLIETKHLARDYGRALVTDENAGELNVGPALSPDGRRLVFLSEKDLFSIDMFLADAATGRVRRKIVKTAADPHFDSLQFINSTGRFDARGERFVFGAVRKGRPVLSILDVERGRTFREIRFPTLGEILNPTWSPDGRRIAFSAITGGLTDLFVYDLQADSLKRLTDDLFADLQPAWSPDGRSIAFVTDRFSSQLAELSLGDYQLALIDPASGEIRPLPGFEGVKNIDPQWSADGTSLYFLSDRGGITNVYRLSLGSGELRQVTDLLTGASGITHLSPSLSVGAGRLAFSVYEEGEHHIYAVDDPDRLAGGPLVPPLEGVNAAELAPPSRSGGEVVALQRRPSFGLPAEGQFRVADYRAKLSLDFVGQPTLTVGADPLGTFVGGGVSLFFSDLLGDHSLGAILQVNGEFEDLGGLVAYVNRKSRWNWGAAVEQIPYLTGRLASGIGSLGGRQVFIEQVELFRETDRAVSLFSFYPFSRVRRFELGASYRNISFAREIETRAFSLATGELLAEEQRDLDAPAGLHLGEASAALVYDASTFGATSPILGRRYRLEVSPTVGSINFSGFLADYRHYVMPVRPYTLAARILHYGRYGGGGEDTRLTPLFIGYPNLVRGYDLNSFGADECGAPEGSSECPPFDRLLGSRILVGNLELRFPPFGALGGKGFYGPLPIELLLFGDAGVAWTRDEKPSFLDGPRKVVKSVGAGARINLFGYAIVEIAYVRPLDRPRKDWSWIFNFRPGF